MKCKRVVALLLTAFLLFSITPLKGTNAEYSETDLAIPAVRAFSANGTGSFALNESSRIYIVNADGNLMRDTGYGDYVELLRLIAAEYSDKGVPSGTAMDLLFGAESNAASGDLVLKLDADSTLLDGVDASVRGQAYRIDASSTGIRVTAIAMSGLLYGARAVLQYHLSGGGMAYGVYLSYPTAQERSLFLDCGRKYFSVSTLQELIRELSWCGMNALELHFSEDMGLRLESTLYPWLAQGGDTSVFGYAAVTNNYHTDAEAGSVLTQAEVSALIDYAQLYGVEIIPSFDLPGHMNYIVAQYNAYLAANGSLSFSYGGQSYTATTSNAGASIGNYFKLNGSFVQYSTNDGVYSRGIDLSNSYATAFALSLLKEYATFFYNNGCTKFNLCADECLGYSVTMNGTTYTTGSTTAGRNLWDCLEHWEDYAVNTLGITGGTAYDTYVSFLNDAASVLRSLGYSGIRVFNDGAYRSPTVTKHVSLASDIAISYWSNASYLDAASAVAADGRTLYNLYANLCYYVVKSGYAADYPNVTTANLLANGGVYNFGADLSAYASQVKGGGFAIWCDDPGYQSQAQVVSAALPLLRARAAKLWNNDYSLSATDFTAIGTLLGSAPNATSAQRALLTPTTEDHSALRALLNNVAAQGENSSELYAAYISAITDGTAVDDDPYASAAQLAAAVAAIQAALDELVLMEEPSPSPTPTPVTYSYTDPAGNVSTVDYYASDSIELPVVIRDYNNDGMLFEYASSEDKSVHTVGGSSVSTPNWRVAPGATTFGGLNLTTLATATVDGSSVYSLTSSASGTGSYVTIYAPDTMPLHAAYAVVTYKSAGSYTPYASEARRWYFRTDTGSSTTAGSTAQCSDFTYAYDGAWHTETLNFSAVGSYAGAASVNYITFFTRLTSGQTLYIKEIAFFSTAADAANYTDPQSIISSETVMSNNLAFGLLFDSMDLRYTADTSHLYQGYGDLTLSPYYITGSNGSGLNKAQDSGQYKRIEAGKTSSGNNAISSYSTNDDGSGNAITSSTRITGYARSGLVETTLGANKQPVYTQATVEYLARLLKAALAIPAYTVKYNTDSAQTPYNSYNYAFVQGAANSTLYGTDADGNARDFAQFLRDKSLSDTETYASTQASFDGTLGGIDSYMDAAYFMLSKLHTDAYSEPVDAYDTLVLHKEVITDAAGTRSVYVFDSAYEATDYNTTTGKIANTTAKRVDWTYPTTGGTMNLNGVYVPRYSFLPINGMGYGNTVSAYSYDDGVDASLTNFGDEYTGKNYNFELEGHAQFVYHQADALYFQFSGDDDVYLYINGILVLDLGAAHGITEEKLNINDLATALGLQEGEAYDFDFYYLERHGYGANLRIETNINLANPDMTVTKTAQQGGTSIPYGGEIDPTAVYTYSFTMLNEGNSQLHNLDFTDPALGVTLAYDEIVMGSYLNGTRTRTVGELTVTVYDASSDTSTVYTSLTRAALMQLLATGLDAGDSITIDGVKYRIEDDDLSSQNKRNTVVGTAHATDGSSLSSRATMLVIFDSDVSVTALGAQAHIMHPSNDLTQAGLYTNGIRFGVELNYKRLQLCLAPGDYFSAGVLLLPLNRLNPSVSDPYDVDEMTLTVAAGTGAYSSNGKPVLVVNSDLVSNAASSETYKRLTTATMIQWTQAMESAGSAASLAALLSDAGLTVFDVYGDGIRFMVYLLFSDNGTLTDSARQLQADREIAYRGFLVTYNAAAGYTMAYSFQKANSATRIFNHYNYDAYTVSNISGATAEELLQGASRYAPPLGQ